ncbi:MAG TPA: hypothetical protein VMT57_09920, partial [Candidatus Thermoplasmatota archaeon]|nr:hypothetical protein [Candidatus Thermoplasmatota archaeon]
HQRRRTHGPAPLPIGSWLSSRPSTNDWSGCSPPTSRGEATCFDQRRCVEVPVNNLLSISRGIITLGRRRDEYVGQVTYFDN